MYTTKYKLQMAARPVPALYMQCAAALSCIYKRLSTPGDKRKTPNSSQKEINCDLLLHLVKGIVNITS